MSAESIVMYVTLAVYNLAVVKMLSSVMNHADMNSAVQEKGVLKSVPVTGYTSDQAHSLDETSYSRVIGLMGGVVMAAFFWAIGNVILYKAFVSPNDVASFVTSLTGYFISGAALFLPYAVNQLRAAFTK